QLVSVILIVIGLALMIYRRIKHQPPLYKEAGPLSWPSPKGKVK
ncbi:prolipoprotein diacylglyceryl transferase, partial [Staphylococcus aureus]|nr:prolipoprotein diacylglyceryl transferase [Staphylococcus aureus]